METYLEK